MDYALSQAKEAELQRIIGEFREFQDTSNAYEAELDAEVETLNQLNENLRKENNSLKHELGELRSTLSKKISNLQQETEAFRSENTRLRENKQETLRLYAELETELDLSWTKLREKEQETGEMTEFYHQTLEDLAITCSELENLKDYSAENTQRLKDYIAELSAELSGACRKSMIWVIGSTRGSVTKSGAVNRLASSLKGLTAHDMVEVLIHFVENKLRYQSYSSSEVLQWSSWV